MSAVGRQSRSWFRNFVSVSWYPLVDQKFSEGQPMAREPDEATTPSNEMQRSRRFDKCRSHEHQKTLNERSFCVFKYGRILTEKQAVCCTFLVLIQFEDSPTILQGSS